MNKEKSVLIILGFCAAYFILSTYFEDAFVYLIAGLIGFVLKSIYAHVRYYHVVLLWSLILFFQVWCIKRVRLRVVNYLLLLTVFVSLYIVDFALYSFSEPLNSLVGSENWIKNVISSLIEGFLFYRICVIFWSKSARSVGDG